MFSAKPARQSAAGFRCIPRRSANRRRGTNPRDRTTDGRPGTASPSRPWRTPGKHRESGRCSRRGCMYRSTANRHRAANRTWDTQCTWLSLCSLYATTLSTAVRTAFTSRAPGARSVAPASPRGASFPVSRGSDRPRGDAPTRIDRRQGSRRRRPG